MKKMSEKSKGIWQLAGILAILAAFAVWIVLSFIYEFDFQPQHIKRGLDLNGGVSITYEVADSKNVTDSMMEDALKNFQKRAEAFSTESNVYREGQYRVNIDIPGAKDAQAVLEKLGKAGKIYFIYAQDRNGTANVVESNGIFLLARSMEDIIADNGVVIDGSMVEDAQADYYNDNAAVSSQQVVIRLDLKSDGAQAFGDATGWCLTQGGMANRIAIVYDNEILSCPGVSAKISDGKAIITGNKSLDEAKELATFIRIGALPFDVKPIRSNIVGATLGSKALSTSLLAGLIGFGLVCLFMIVIYRIPGLAASISLIFYTGIMLVLMKLFDVTLTLPGIAGIILSIGMAVDANVIIFTRIREEIATGKTVRSSMKLGYNKATSAIVDGNVTTLIAAIVLYAFGSGMIKGFAITLGLGILVSMFSGLIITKWIMNCVYNLGIRDSVFYGKEVHSKKLNVVKHWKVYSCISGALIVLGIVMLFVNKGAKGDALNFGLDFVGGSSVQVNFDGAVPNNTDVEVLVKSSINENCSVSEVKGENALIIKTKAFLDDESKLSVLKQALMDKYGVAADSIETETISGTISGEMKRDALIAVIIATICMLLYILIRFHNVAFAVSAVIALVHDVLVVFALYSVCRITVDTSFIAVMLTLVGYSINATIVIFDRIREQMKLMTPKTQLIDVVNESISDTFTRSINTTITTLLTVVMLIILGVDSVRIFAIPLAVGLVCGAYSSICITGTLWYGMKSKFGKKAN